jgi:hypothetical protein
MKSLTAYPDRMAATNLRATENDEHFTGPNRPVNEDNRVRGE